MDEFDWPADDYKDMEFILSYYRVHAWVVVNGRRLNVSEAFSRILLDTIADEAIGYITHNWAHALAKGIIDPPTATATATGGEGTR